MEYRSTPNRDDQEKNFWSMRDQEIRFVEKQMTLDVFTENHLANSQAPVE